MIQINLEKKDQIMMKYNKKNNYKSMTRINRFLLEGGKLLYDLKHIQK